MPTVMLHLKYRPIFLGLLFAATVLLAACSAGVEGVPEPVAASPSSLAAGRHLIAAYGCGSCHSIPGVAGADAMAAPPLDDFWERSYIAGRLPNTEANLVQWITDPQKVVPGNAMPDLGVTEAEARDIAAYLYHQPTLADLVSR
jgi:cytochrome c